MLQTLKNCTRSFTPPKICLGFLALGRLALELKKGHLTWLKLTDGHKSTAALFLIFTPACTIHALGADNYGLFWFFFFLPNITLSSPSYFLVVGAIRKSVANEC